jgi:hypothetical protein
MLMFHTLLWPHDRFCAVFTLMCVDSRLCRRSRGDRWNNWLVTTLLLLMAILAASLSVVLNRCVRVQAGRSTLIPTGPAVESGMSVASPVSTHSRTVVAA